MCRDSIVIAFGVCLMAACAFGYSRSAAQPANCLDSPADSAHCRNLSRQFRGWHSVGKKAWLQATGGSQLIFHLCSVNDGRRYLIAKNDDGNDFNPGKYSRFEWVRKGRPAVLLPAGIRRGLGSGGGGFCADTCRRSFGRQRQGVRSLRAISPGAS